MTLEQLNLFVKVVEAGSFTGAADVLGLQRSYVSRVIAQLEAMLGVKLLERTTRSQSLTEAGRQVYDRAVGILEAVEDALHVAQKVHSEPRGLLRVTCGVEFGMAAVGAWIEAYLVRYPHTRVEVEYTSRELDLVHEGFDVAVRAGPLQESRLVARHLGQIENGLFAGAQYVQREGLPQQPQDLARHALIRYTGGRSKLWQIHHPEHKEAYHIEHPARVLVNAGIGVRDAILKGLGIGQLPLPVAAELVSAGRLVRVLPQWQPAPVSVYAVYPSSRYLTPKVRAFVDIGLRQFAFANIAHGVRPALPQNLDAVFP